MSCVVRYLSGMKYCLFVGCEQAMCMTIVETFAVCVIGKMAQYAVKYYGAIPILFDWFLRVLSLHELALFRKKISMCTHAFYCFFVYVYFMIMDAVCRPVEIQSESKKEGEVRRGMKRKG